jgi:hypothetical protein
LEEGLKTSPLNTLGASFATVYRKFEFLANFGITKEKR